MPNDFGMREIWRSICGQMSGQHQSENEIINCSKNMHGINLKYQQWHVAILLALQNVLTSSKVKPNPIGWKSTLTRWKSLQYRKPYWFLIFNCVSSLHFSPAQEWRSPTATQIWCSSHVITCDWDAVVLLPQSHSRCSPAVSATLVRIMLPRVVFSVPEAQLAHLRRRGKGPSTACVGQPVVTTCKISHISISFSYHFARNDGLDFVFLLD